MGISAFLEKMLMARQLTFDEGRFELLGIRGVNLPIFTVTRFIEEIYELEREETFDILFDVGKKHGKYGIQQLGEKHKLKKREFFEKTMGSANIMGLGYMELQRFNPEQGILVATITDSPFVEEFQKSELLKDIDHPVDHLQRGMFHAMCQEIFDAPVTSEETQCALQGHKHCTLRVTAEDIHEQ